MTQDLVTGSDPAIGIRQSALRGSLARIWRHASAYAGAREAESNFAESITARRSRARWLKSLVEAPEIWSQQRPPVEQIWLYGRFGKQVGDAGFLRLSVTGWGLIGAASNAALYAAAWIVVVPCFLGQHLPPVDVLSVPRPAARDVWRTGMGRSVGIRLWTVVAVAVVLAAYELGWITARLSRTVATGLLYVVLAHVIDLPLPWPSWMP